MPLKTICAKTRILADCGSSVRQTAPISLVAYVQLVTKIFRTRCSTLVEGQRRCQWSRISNFLKSKGSCFRLSWRILDCQLRLTKLRFMRTVLKLRTYDIVSGPFERPSLLQGLCPRSK